MAVRTARSAATRQRVADALMRDAATRRDDGGSGKLGSEVEMARPWAEIDEDWRRKEERALAQRAANAAAALEGQPLPSPNPFSTLGPKKLSPEASREEYHQWYLEQRKACRPFQPKRHTI